jgi:hypothetical protein
MIYGGVEHNIWAFLRGEGDFSPDESADAITDIIYRGLASPAGVIDRGEQAIRRLEQVAARLEDFAGLAPGLTCTTGKNPC